MVDIDPAKLKRLLSDKGISDTEADAMISQAEKPAARRRGGVRGHGAAEPKKGELGSL